MNQENTSPTQISDDLFWTACCFVSGDLSTEMESEFEQRLASDQSAREAVALAVETLGVTRAALSLAVELPGSTISANAAGPMRNRPLMVGLTVGLVAVAACLVAMVSWPLIPGRNVAQENGSGGSGGSAKVNAGSVHNLALAWHQTRLELLAADEAELADILPVNSPATDEDLQESRETSASYGGDLTDAMQVADTPDWMVTALGGLPEDAIEVREPRDEG